MRNTTRLIFNGYLSHVAQLNGVAEAVHKFNVEPTVQQKLETAIQESNSMLQMINVIGVDDQSGEALLLDVNGPLASRTNTGGGNRRQPKDRHALTKDTYVCKLTEFDAAFAYQLLDQWAKLDDFQVRLTNAIAHRQGLDRIMVGFNGITAEVETDSDANPLGQDVNIGWLQKIRAGAPDRVIDEVVAASGQVTIGAAGDYKTLDGLVTDAKNLLAEQHKNAPDLVAIVSRNLMSSKLLKAVEKGAASNQEELAADEIVTKARLGGLPLYDAPYFPDGTVLVTSLNNLSIYWQEGGRRRHIKDEPEYNRVADYQSSNDAYVIEDLTKVALVENIVEV
jgi:P2 family phage major capsid protein